ncbi:MAG: zinc-dependent peptidase [Bacteroidota bacterium]
MMIYFILLAVLVLAILVFRKRSSDVPAEFPDSWKKILVEKVSFYAQLDNMQKEVFEDDVLRFLEDVRITGVETEVDITDRLLVASSAVIPVLGFPGWEYTFLDEVLLYPGAFDRNFGEASAESEYITGMVGNGPMEGKMILSKPSLHLGFSNDRDKKNVGVHEFIHLIDKEDGSIDGLPLQLNKEVYAVPWLELIRTKTQQILENKSDINSYGATNQQEFLSVAGEYFFERPHLLKSKHPELYKYLSLAFNQQPEEVIDKRRSRRQKPGRNSPCICGSGEKYKNCCLS